MVRTNSHTRQDLSITPNPCLSINRAPGSVPGMIRRYALSEQQALLAILQYNRMIDIFTEAVCYFPESSLRTFLPGIGEVDTNAVYLGVDMAGRRFVFPVQARGRHDTIGTSQVERDLAACASKFPDLICRPIGAQLIEDDMIAMFEFTLSGSEVSIKEERHYRLVPNDDLTDEELMTHCS